MIEQKDPLQSVLAAIEEMQEDSTVPRNVKTRLAEVAKLLQSEGDLSMHVNKALDEIDEISGDTNLQSFTRTQLWNIVSMLETLA